MLSEFLTKQMVLVCGSGGVGKTSLSAALAAKLALNDKSVCLITVDPAKRLAAALGLESLASKPVSLEKNFIKHWPAFKNKKLDAMMFSAESAKDDFFTHFGDEKLAAEFANSYLFETLFNEFSGVHEYFILEALYQVKQTAKYDVIVLDTPPARNALAFLEAPDRIARFFDDRIFKIFLKEPQNNTLIEKVRAKASAVTFSLLEKLTGAGPVGEIIRLAPNIQKIKTAFLAHQTEIKNLLSSSASTGIFVVNPRSIPFAETKSFFVEAEELKVNLQTVVFNRSLRHLFADKSIANKQSNTTTEKLRLLINQEIANSDALMSEIKQSATKIFIPELEQPIYDILTLKQLVETI